MFFLIFIFCVIQTHLYKSLLKTLKRIRSEIHEKQCLCQQTRTNHRFSLYAFNVKFNRNQCSGFGCELYGRRNMTPVFCVHILSFVVSRYTVVNGQKELIIIDSLIPGPQLQLHRFISISFIFQKFTFPRVLTTIFRSVVTRIQNRGSRRTEFQLLFYILSEYF